MLLGTSPQAVIGKMLIDQAVSAPIILSLFYTGKNTIKLYIHMYKTVVLKVVGRFPLKG